MSELAYEKRVLALAGIIQACHLVASAARSGMVSQDSLANSLKSIFVQNPDSFTDIYSGTADIRLGLNLLNEVLLKFDTGKHAEMIRYALAVMSLERNLAKRPDILNKLGEQIDVIGRERTSLAAESIDDTVAALADLYESTISLIQPQLRIEGNKHHLQNISNVQRIRALLLSAIRSTVLWHQVGGRRWQLLICRGQMKTAIKNVL